MSLDRQLETTVSSSTTSREASPDMDFLTLRIRSLDLPKKVDCQEEDEEDVEDEVEFFESGEESRGEARKIREDSLDRQWTSRGTEEENFRSSDEGPLAIISLDEVAWHDTPEDCWLVIYDYVYDCTDFLKRHPGGEDTLLEYAGRDATLAFVGAGHSKCAVEVLKRYLIGELPRVERIFRVPDGVKLHGLYDANS
ncbi:uncharacterized heme-binding protein C330.03c [Orussus abietinus]|uniref:uncharacterized heme-binding protein C330.03c n=1 Tax=Orussus abietinus TaxID=222816 RepID=UPI0006265961|nr:uncharacterized heme-binding protein C330.03c [Orussus abietinus]